MSAFRKQQIRICPDPAYQLDGQDFMLIDALVRASVAYHPTRGLDPPIIRGEWTVTHLKTGYAFLQRLTRQEARELALEIAPLMPDKGEWGSGDFSKIGPPKLFKQIRSILVPYHNAELHRQVY